MTRLGKAAKEAYQKAFNEAFLNAKKTPEEATVIAWDACVVVVLKENDRIKWEETQEDARIFG